MAASESASPDDTDTSKLFLKPIYIILFHILAVDCPPSATTERKHAPSEFGFHGAVQSEQLLTTVTSGRETVLLAPTMKGSVATEPDAV